MSEITFCGVCRHRTPEHEPNCPVLTGEAQLGSNYPQQLLQAMAEQQSQLQGQIASMGNISVQCPFCGGQNGMHYWASGSRCPGAEPPQNPWQQGPSTNVWPSQVMNDGYEVAKIYKEAREKLLQELKAQLEVNRRLARDLMEARLELAQYKLKHHATTGV